MSSGPRCRYCREAITYALLARSWVHRDTGSRWCRGKVTRAAP